MKKLILSLAMLMMFSVAFGQSQFGQRQVTGHAYTSDGMLKQGLQGLVLITSGGFTGSIAGATLPSSTVITVPVYPQNYLGDIYYKVSAGTLYTLEVR